MSGFFGGGGAPPQGTAATDDVRSPKTFESAQQSGVATGTLADNGNGATITPGTTAQTIAAGIWDTVNTVEGDTNLVASNIRAGTSIFGVAGDTNVIDTTTATGAMAGDILTGTDAFANGSAITGSMPDNGALGTYTPTTTSQAIPAGYASGGTVAGDVNLLAANIKSGVSIFSVAGSYAGATIKVATGTVAVTTSPTKNFTLYGGNTTTFNAEYSVTIPVPSGAQEIIAVLCNPWSSYVPPFTGDFQNVGTIIASEMGYACGTNDPTVLCHLTMPNSGSFTASWDFIAGQDLQVSTSGIVLPYQAGFGSPSIAYTVFYY